MENLFIMANGATTSLTTANPTAQTTGTAGTASVLMQLTTPATKQITLVEYGVSLSGAPAAATLSLRNTSSTATVTAGVATAYSNPGGPASVLTYSTTTCGYTTAATAPTGTVAEIYDLQLLTTNTYIKQWPMEREPTVPVSGFLQLVINVPTTAVTAYAYIIWRE
jgi:hypothetical protein